MEPYRVQLDVYNGPLDLLLYLIRRDEVDVYDIPIARVTEQYCRYIEMIQQVDPNLAGEFLVMAASLIEIKTRMLLPSPSPEEAGEQPGLGDPRADLVRQLLQYKAFKDAAVQLRDVADQHALRHARQPARPDFGPPELELENVQVWHLLEAFSQVMAAIGRKPAQHQVVYDDTPIALHAADLLDRLRGKGNLTFREAFEGRTSRAEIVGLFLAMLELIRQKQILVQQEKVFGEIYLFPRIDAGQTPDMQGEEAMIAFDEKHTMDSLVEEPLLRPGELITDAGAMLAQWESSESLELLNARRNKGEEKDLGEDLGDDDDEEDEEEAEEDDFGDDEKKEEEEELEEGEELEEDEDLEEEDPEGDELDEDELEEDEEFEDDEDFDEEEEEDDLEEDDEDLDEEEDDGEEL